MAYTFELRPLKSPLVLDQLGAALREREERLSRPREKRDSPAARRRRRARRYRAYLGALSLMGLALALRGRLVPGLTLALCCGAWLLWSREPKPPPPVPAGRLVKELKRAERNGARVTFSEESMCLLAADGRREDVGYEALALGFESDDLLVLTGERRAVALQKLELTWGDWEDFRAFLSERVGELVDMRIKGGG